MSIHFYKYQATGNDFVLIDNRKKNLKLSAVEVSTLCDRRFGVGADGVILIQNSSQADFEMVYFNPDGSQSLCGNGSRSAVALAATLRMINNHTTFLAYDGLHQASLLASNEVRLKMNPVEGIKEIHDGYFLNTGSPHFIRFVTNLDDMDVVNEGRKLRYDNSFKPNGTNVNFVELLTDNSLYVRTYERGVENETLSCGTGVTAAALAASRKGYASPVKIRTKGGHLSVEFRQVRGMAVQGDPVDLFDDIFLIGPAKMVFEGTLEL